MCSRVVREQLGMQSRKDRVIGRRKGEGKKYLTPCLTSFGIIPGMGKNRRTQNWIRGVGRFGRSVDRIVRLTTDEVGFGLSKGGH